MKRENGDGDPLPNNPLQHFPMRQDKVIKTLHTKSAQGLFLTKNDGSYGVSSGNDTRLRRAFRRVESSNLFATTRDVSLKTLNASPPHKARNYVLLEEERLGELLRLEEILRKERELLGNQCAQVLPAVHGISPNIPVPINLIGITSACDAEIHKATEDLQRLVKDWHLFSVQNHYDKPHLYLNNSFLENCPVSERILKTKMLASSVKAWRQRYNRDSMCFEDDHSRLTARAQNASERKRDYHIYYILATRYGPYDMELFISLPHPGAHYLQRATRGARMLQKIWYTYFQFKSQRRARKATRIQKYVRRYLCQKKYYPVIRMRCKMKNRLRCIACLHKWKAYLSMCRRIKLLLFDWKDYRRSETLAFYSWRDQYKQKIAWRRSVLEPALVTRRKRIVQKLFQLWKNYVFQLANIKSMKMTLSKYPHFYIWRRNVKEQRNIMRLHRAALIVQKFMRMNRMKIILRANKKVRVNIGGFISIIVARKVARLRRNMAIKAEFEQWWGERQEQLERSSISIERNRLWRQLQFTSKAEQDKLQELRSHLLSKDGQMQLQVEAYRKCVEAGVAGNDKKALEVARNEVEQALLDGCSRIAREVSRHDFESRAPPYLRCPLPSCRSIFTTSDQYCQHATRSIAHKDDAANYSELHQVLLSPSERDVLSNFIIRKVGIGPLVNVIDLFVELQSWRRLPTSTAAYKEKAIAIYDMFLSKDAVRPVRLSGDAIMLQSLEMHRGIQTASAYERREVPTQSILRRILGLPKQAYNVWTSDKVLLPSVFESLEWKLLQELSLGMKDQQCEFFGSNEARAIQAEKVAYGEKKKAEGFNEFTYSRLDGIRLWAANFRHVELLISAEAENVVDIISESLIDKLVDSLLKQAVVERQNLEESYKEQVTVQIEDVVVEDLFNLLAPALVKMMLGIPAYRLCAMRFIDENAALELVLALSSAGSSASHAHVENQLGIMVRMLPLSHAHRDINDCSTLIQTMVRRWLAVRKVRKLFTRRFVKKYDPSSNSMYYLNTETGEVVVRPLLTNKLFPQSKW